MHIWLISAFEPTPIDNTRPMRFMGIADAAISRGHRVTFFSSIFRHSTKQFRFSKPTRQTINENYDLVFVNSPSYHKNISFKRMLAHYEYAKNLVNEAEKVDGPDVIFISIPPISSAALIMEWAGKKNIPVFTDIIDPWPDVFLKAFPQSVVPLAKASLSPLYRKMRRTLSKAAGVTAISSEYITWAKSFCPHVPTAFFYPAVAFKEIQDQLSKLPPKENDDKLRLTYAGSLASSYDIPTIIEAAKQLEEKFPGKTAFDIAGAGPQDKIVIAAQSNLPNVRFLGRLDREQLLKQYAISDLGLMQHIKGATQTVTYKVFDYLSAGLPIINSLQSEVVKMFSENKVGISHEPGDVKGLVSAIEKFLLSKDLLQTYKKNALAYTSQYGDTEVVYGNLIKFIENTITVSKEQ